MIDFLRKYGIPEEVLVEIARNNDETLLYNLSCNTKNIGRILPYMVSIGIKNINNILIYKAEIFTLTFSEFIKKISKFNIPVFVETINNDYTKIDLID